MYMCFLEAPLLPCRLLEAEGTEKTFRFKQDDIAAAVPVANAQQVCGERERGGGGRERDRGEG